MIHFDDVVDIVNLAVDNGITVSLKGDKINLKLDKDKSIDEDFLDLIKSNKGRIIKFLKDQKLALSQGEALLPPIAKIDRAQYPRIPLSYAQQRLWFLDKFENSTHYQLPTVVDIDGHLSIADLEYAFKTVVNRHEILRTVYREEDGVAFQQIQDTNRWTMDYTDARNLELSFNLDEQIEEAILTPFDLSEDHMIRAQLIQNEEQQYTLILVLHHIAADAWSIPILINELIETYQARIKGKDNPLKPLDIQYADFAVWEREYLTEDLLEEKLQYWENKLAQCEKIKLPTDYQRPMILSNQGGTFKFSLDGPLSKQLKSLAEEEEVTTFMLLLAALKVLFYKYTGQQDLVIGTPVANRLHEGLEGLIGFFINRLPIRTRLAGGFSFAQLLSIIKENTLEAYAHQDTPFEKIVERSKKGRDLKYSPLTQVVLAYGHGNKRAYQLNETTFSAHLFEHKIAKFDLVFYVHENDEGLTFNIQYASDLFKRETVERLGQHLEQLLISFSDDKHTTIDELQLIETEQTNKLESYYPASQVQYPMDQTIVDLFLANAQASPNKVALVHEDQEWTYSTLNQRSNQLANYLNQRGIGAGTIAAVGCENPLQAMVGILGVMKIGATYVPVDTEWPMERITYILQETNAKALIVDQEDFCSDTNYDGELDLVVNLRSTLLDEVTKDNICGELNPENLAYVLYTSGSTGRPKGVKIKHRSLLDYWFGIKEYVNFNSFQAFGLMSTLTADLGHTMVFGALCSGGTLHLFSKESLSQAERLHAYFATHVVDCIKIVPSHWKALFWDSTPLSPKKAIIFGGEKLPQGIPEGLRQTNPEVKVYNHYGPTETTVGKLLYEVEDTNGMNSIPIGRPFGNTQVYVVDQLMNLCPVGVAGELLIGGDGVSTGYLNHEELTKKHFVVHAFTKDIKQVYYRTGDRVRLLSDGNIEFLGRIDNQVKIRGYRVELEEIEQVLHEHSAIRQTAVIGLGEEANLELVAFVSSSSDVERQELYDYLQTRLPSYMIPTRLFVKDELPLNTNGKINRQELIHLANNSKEDKVHKAPASSLEKKISDIWALKLKREKIGVDENFFTIGGHSLLATQVVSVIRKSLQVDISIRDIFRYNTVETLARYIQDKEALTGTAIRKQTRPTRIPLSYSQERLWFIDRLEGSTQYHIPIALRLEGKLEVTALREALQQIVDRHESLRTIFKDKEGIAYQEVLRAGEWELSYSADRMDETEEGDLLFDFIKSPFNLAQDHMVRALLVRRDEKEHLLVLVLHHIAADGWSLPVLLDELVQLYRAKTQQQPSPLPPLDIQYADYAIWQREHLNEQKLKQALSYWKDRLKGWERLNLPTDRPRTAIQRYEGAKLTYRLDETLTKKLQHLAEQEGVTLYILLLAAFKCLLHHYTNQKDIIVSSPIANRTQAEIEPLIGFFINTLVLRSQIDGLVPFTTLLQQLKEIALEAYEHQAVPFEKVVDTVVESRDLSVNPLAQVVFLLRNNPNDVNVQDLSELKINAFPVETKVSLSDLHICITEIDGELDIVCSYSTQLFFAETVERMMGHYTRILRAIVEDSSVTIGKLPLLSATDLQQVVQVFNDTACPYPEDKTIVDVFEEQVLRTPENLALKFGEVALSYQDLNQKANRLAAYLTSEFGLEKGQLIGVMMERSEWAIISILGILKAGGVYVPIDPAYPEERKSYLIEDAGLKGLIILSASMFETMAYPVKSIVLDIQFDDFPTVWTDSVLIEPQDLAYVIYTSGSTGQPKGVMVAHGSNVNMSLAQVEAFGIREEDSVLQLASLSFDASISEIFMALYAGASLVLIDQQRILDTNQFLTYLQAEEISVVTLTPAYASLLNIEQLNGLRVIISAGEAAKVDFASRCATFVDYFNAYGPTECAVCSSIYQVSVEDKDRSQIPIGKPIANTSIYILNQYGGPVPIGVFGELYIAGPNVAQGYLHRPHLTKEKFICDPLGIASGLVYKSGDIGRWLPTGEIEFAGRQDNQVKVNGHRVELGEIETVIKKNPAVADAVVLLDESVGEGKRLVAFYVCKEGSAIELSDLQGFLREQLPSFMVPTQLKLLQQMPLTVNGKTDKKALAEIEIQPLQAQQYAPPTTEMEEQLVEIWKDLLQVERVGIHDNFFDLGGDSIISIQIVSRARGLKYVIQPRDIFEYQTIAKLATGVAKRSQRSEAEQGQLIGAAPLAPIQKWFFEQPYQQKSHYNQSNLFKIPKSISQELVNRALSQLIDQHDALRFVYEKEGEEWKQSYGEHVELLNMEEVSANKGNPAINDQIKQIAQAYQSALDITQGRLLKAVLITTPEEEEYNRLLIIIHHLAVDGVSWRILLSQLQELLEAYRVGDEVNLGPKTSSYREWTKVLQSYVLSDQIEQQQNYWEKSIAGYSALPVDVPESENKCTHRGSLGSVDVSLDPALTQELLMGINQVYHTEINDLLLSALAKTLGEWAHTNRLLIGMEGHGRDFIVPEVDVSNTVGWFTSSYPLSLHCSKLGDLSVLIPEVKEGIRSIPNKGLGFGLLRYLHPDEKYRETLQSAKWDLVFNYLGQLDNVIDDQALIQPAAEERGDNISESYQQDARIILTAAITNNKLNLNWRFSETHYLESTFQDLADKYIANLKAIIGHCRNAIQHKSTPSDFLLGPEISSAELDRFLLQQSQTKSAAQSIERLYRLSPLQEGFVFHYLFNKYTKDYIEQIRIDFPEGIDVESLKAAFQYVLESYSIFRSSFVTEGFEIPFQCVHKSVDLPFQLLDYSLLTPSEQVSQYQTFLAEDSSRPFDFREPPLMRLILVKMGASEYKMIWTFHHILMDGWSMSQLLPVLASAYSTYAKGETPKPRIEDRYEDYIRYIASQDNYQEERFWKNYLGDLENNCLLPFVPNHIDRNKGGGVVKEEKAIFSLEKSQQLRQLAQRKQLTVNTLVQGVWALLLHKYSRKEDVVFGVTVSGRPTDLANAEQRVGLYINTIPLRVKVNENALIEDWLKEIQVGHTAAREFQYSSLNTIQGWTDVKGELFDSIMVFENYPVSSISAEDNPLLQVGDMTSDDQMNYLLGVKLSIRDKLVLKLNYNSDLLATYYVQMIKRQFLSVLDQLIEGQVERISDIDIVREDRNRLLHEFNATAKAFPSATNVVQLFEKQVGETPDALAVQCGQVELTYKQINTLANTLANSLIQDYGIQKGDLVGILMERSEWTLVSLLGILKAGATFVPIDLDYPEDRKTFIIQDTGIKALVIHSDHLFEVHAYQMNILAIDVQIHEFEIISKNLNQAADDQAAYVIYTSGSTGQPKGVLISHSALYNYISWGLSYYKKDSTNFNFPFFSPLTFDLTQTSIFLTLLSGGTLFVEPGNNVNLQLRSILSNPEINALKLTPAHVALIEEGMKSEIDTFILGGEALRKEHVKKLRAVAPNGRIYNEYGPTEATVGCSVCEVETDQPITIGRPIANAQLYILDVRGNLVPEGVVGEIYIAGKGLAMGYLNRPELTAERFVSYSLNGDLKTQLYRTGDLGRWLPDGNIEYLGREDQQVKIRGYRIELGEINTILATHKQVKQSVVIAKEDVHKVNNLVAFVVPEGKFNKESLQVHLKRKLPAYMVPSLFVPLEEIPLTKNGKVDTNALPLPEGLNVVNTKYQAPRNPIEEQLAKIWEEVLKVRRVGVFDNFFDLGGHSLLAIKLMAQVNKIFCLNMDITVLFDFPTIELLAEKVQSNFEHTYPTVVKFNEGTEKPYLFCIPSIGGRAINYFELGKLIGNERGLYAFQLPGLDGVQPPLERIEDMATLLIEEILKLDDVGPYYLVGYSFGVKIMAEVVAQLEARGLKIVHLFVLDTPLPMQEDQHEHSYEELLLAWGKIHIERFAEDATLSVDDLQGKTKEEKLLLLHNEITALGTDMTYLYFKGRINVWMANYMSKYIVDINQPYDIPVTLICQYPDGDYRWQHFTSNDIHIYKTAGHHRTLLKKPFVQEVAAHINEVFTQ